ncbi:hypothetical protein MKX01_030950 [Papaver californicum]|nr:hypothetical protein MKX01_030950 [Papaver californicum]
MEMAIVMPRDSGMDWIIHLDTDELIHPAGASEYSLRQFLLDLLRWRIIWAVQVCSYVNPESLVSWSRIHGFRANLLKLSFDPSNPKLLI